MDTFVTQICQNLLGHIRHAVDEDLLPAEDKTVLLDLAETLDKNMKTDSPESYCYLGDFTSRMGVLDPYHSDKYYKAAFSLFLLASEMKYIPGIRNVGICYLCGDGVDKNAVKAISYLKTAADMGDIKAQIELGVAYSIESEPIRDPEKALHYLTTAAQTEDPEALYYLGLYYYKNNDYENAWYWLQKSFSADCFKAARYLSSIYLFGLGQPQDVEKALSLLKKGSNEGDDEACYGLALMYLNGGINDIAVEQNIDLGIQFLKKAVNANNIEAIRHYASILLDGDNVSKDVDKAKQLLEYTASQNDLESQLFLADLYYENTEIDQDYEKVFYWTKRASEQSQDFPIMRNLAQMYIEGLGVTADREKGINILKECIARGDDTAQKLLDEYL